MVSSDDESVMSGALSVAVAFSLFPLPHPIVPAAMTEASIADISLCLFFIPFPLSWLYFIKTVYIKTRAEKRKIVPNTWTIHDIYDIIDIQIPKARFIRWNHS